MDNYEDHDADDFIDWYTTLIGVKFEIYSPKNHEHRQVAIFKEKMFPNVKQTENKTLISRIMKTSPNQTTTRLRSP